MCNLNIDIVSSDVLQYQYIGPALVRTDTGGLLVGLCCQQKYPVQTDFAEWQ